MTARVRIEADPVRRRRLGLTPLIDVIFLLLVFFLLASRFERDRGLPIGLAGGGAWEGAPRLVTLSADGAAFNGIPGALEQVAAQAARASEGVRPVAIVADTGTDVARIAAALEALRIAGAGPALLAPPLEISEP